MIRQRRPAAEDPTSIPVPVAPTPPQPGKKMGPDSRDAGVASVGDNERRPLVDGDRRSDQGDEQADIESSSSKMALMRQNQWIVLAVASGACAAFNGVFAKLTTTELTTSFAQGVARVLHLDAVEEAIEYIVRAVSFPNLNVGLTTQFPQSNTKSEKRPSPQAFFGLNLVFNGVMWTLFTKALARGHSTTQVSIMNTSSNFFITAMLGLVIFSESLPPLWWVGAGFLVVGNVIIGSNDESGKAAGDGSAAIPAPGEDGLGAYEDVPQAEGARGAEAAKDDDEDVVELGDLDEEHHD